MALLAVASSLLASNWLAVVLRVVARRRVHALSLEDLLMCFGVVRRARTPVSSLQC